MTAGEIDSRIDDRVGDRLDHLAAGAQASINTATLLFGDERWKIKGFVEETREQLAALKTEAEADRKLAEQRHDQNTERLDKLEECAHPVLRTWRKFVAATAFVSKEWKLFAGCVSALGFGYSMPSAFAMVRRIGHYLFSRPHGH